jgi:hypothetical protein
LNEAVVETPDGPKPILQFAGGRPAIDQRHHRRAESAHSRRDAGDVLRDLAFDNASHVLQLNGERVVEDALGRLVAPDADDRGRHQRHADHREQQRDEEPGPVARQPAGAEHRDEAPEDREPRDGGHGHRDGQ